MHHEQTEKSGGCAVGWNNGIGQVEEGLPGNWKPAKRWKEYSRSETARKKRLFLGFSILEEEVREF